MTRELDPKKFFTKEEESQIIQAIQRAEKATSGEVRVHLAKEIKGDPIKEAVNIFNRLGMQKTRQRNGCLVLIGLKNKKIAVIGDKGINERVGENFWQEIIKLLTERFKNEDYVKGLIMAIGMIGEKLKHYFPYTSGDVNELSDEISKEKNNGNYDSNSGNSVGETYLIEKMKPAKNLSRMLSWFGVFIAIVSVLGYIISRTVGLSLITTEPDV